ncbi:uncharacterized protein B0P05DRAFT_580413 [Gilbertella persicaria]|uniref:uncharacterized protein n=1 Tax=Gilbertella persicaria TaxID=101096 RepID=UPI00221F4A8C|nr:uncharacterized protein B0P05DRAFT_580413 [Gilbertella persicaria]KAI8070533.1 hypothetical protein B0P05DRAFT_580413 [Gilbertella persicaria]
MKEAGYEIIGYARKSKVFLLNLMVEKLKTRSLADRVFISPNSFAGDPFNKRGENKREELMSHIIANGDTQDMLRYISDKKKKVILVTIDYAVLTTNCEDMKSFLSSIKEIAIDLIPSQNKVKMYTSQELLLKYGYIIY